MAGYLSLHQSSHGLTIKWTPNQLMNGYVETENQDKRYATPNKERILLFQISNGHIFYLTIVKWKRL